MKKFFYFSITIFCVILSGLFIQFCSTERITETKLSKVLAMCDESHNYDNYGSNINAMSDEQDQQLDVNVVSNSSLISTKNSNSYIVSFDAKGGSVVADIFIVTLNEQYGDLPIPTKRGYVFEGWYTALVDGEKVEASTLVQTEGDHTLYAEWSAIPTTITTSKTTAEETYGYAEAFNVSTITAQSGGEDWTYSMSNSTNFIITKNANGAAILKFKTGANAGTYTTTVTATSAYNETTATTEEITVTINQADFDLTAVWSTTKVGCVEITSSVVIQCTAHLFKDGVRTGSSYVSDVGADGLEESDIWMSYGFAREREKGAYSVVVVARPENSNYKQKQVSTDEVLAYKVTLVAGEGITEAYGSQNCNGAMLCGEKFSIGVEVEDGYTWSKWIHEGATLTNFNPTKASNFNIVMGAGDVTLTATVLPNSYEVSFNAKGGTASPETITVDYNSNYGELPEPTKEKCIFTGWYTEEVGGTEVVSTTKVLTTKNHTLYARWAELTCSNSSAQYLASLSQASAVTFAINIDSEVKWFDNNQEIIGATDTTLIYMPSTFGVHEISCRTIESKCASFEIVYYQRPSEINIEKEADNSILNLYTFRATHNSTCVDEAKFAWYKTELDGSQNFISNGAYLELVINTYCRIVLFYSDGRYTTSDLSDFIYPKFIISFDSLEGSTSENRQIVEYGQMVSAPTNPTKDNYIFAGWYTDEDFNNVWDFDSAVKEDLNLRAKWVQLECSDLTLLTQHTSNLQNVTFTIDLLDEEIVWYVNDVLQETISDAEFVFYPNETTVGKFIIYCKVGDVVSNSLEVLVYYTPTKLEIDFTKVETGHYRLIVNHDDLFIDESKILWYAKTDGQDILIGRGFNPTLKTFKAREIYAVYQDEDYIVVSNSIKISADIAPYILYIIIGFVVALVLMVAIIISVKLVKKRKAKKLNEKLYKDVMQDKKER